MYNVWWLVIASAILIIVCSITFIVYGHFEGEVEKEYDRLDKELKDYYFANRKYEQDLVSQRDEARRKLNKLENNKFLYIPIVLEVIAISVFMASLLIAIISPIEAKKEYNKYEETYIMMQQIYDEDKQFENFELTQNVIEFNQWLAKARASKKTYGNWSSYCNLDLDRLDYITLKGEQNGNY